MMFFKKRKEQQAAFATQERQIKSITGHNKRRIKEATEPIEKLTKKYEANGVTLEIAKAISRSHG